jgi:hypothetical protein
MLALLIFAAVPSLSFASGTGYGVLGSDRTIEVLGGKAELFLKEGWEFLDSNAYFRYYDYDENPYDAEYAEYYDFSYIVPVADDEDWSFYITREKVGHVDEVYALDEARLLDYCRSIYGPEAGFFIKPAYDSEKFKWSWGIYYDPSWGDYYAYDELYLTREGYLRLEFYGDDISLKSVLDEASEAVTISAGNEYLDFDPDSDEVCEYDVFESILYGWGDEDDYGWEDESAYSWTSAVHSIDVDYVFNIISRVFMAFVTLTIIFAVRMSFSRALKGKSRARKKSYNEKTPFSLKKTRDDEWVGDEEAYYRRLRAEEERYASKYD